MKPARVVLLALGAVAIAALAKKYFTPGEVPDPPRPIQDVGTSTAGRASNDPEKPEKKGHDDAFDLLHPHGRSPEEKKPDKP